MATTTPNYGWTVPTSSDLVKNGATAIETLGDSVDASLWNSGYGQAGKNKIINGDFAINQRSFTSTTTSGTFGFDRFKVAAAGGTSTYSAQTFTPGTAPVAGYEAANYARLVTASQSAAGDYCYLVQSIEDVRTLANQTATISFWAKASTGTPNVGVSLEQVFGSGGSSLVVTSAGVSAITTSWARYSFTVSVPSISGKTIGTSSKLAVGVFTSAGTTISGSGYPAVGVQNATIDIWGVQTEYGSKATPFQTASGGSPQAELAMCQRYYYRTSPTVTGYPLSTTGGNLTTAIGQVPIPLPVQMRVAPTTMDSSSLSYLDFATITALITGTFTLQNSTQNYASVRYTHGSAVLTAGNVGALNTNGTSAYLGFSAEL